jgi:RNA polymerase sigma-70 factor (ECF subfamily)
MKTKTLNDFDLLVDRHSREIFSYLFRMLRDQQDAEDASQETFLRAFRAFPRLKNDSNLRAWLYKIATNVAYTQIKTRKRITENTLDLAATKISSPNHNMEQGDLLEIIFQAVNKLPYKQKAALLLRNYQGCSYEEISAALNCSNQAARANVYQAIKRLRTQFAK